jgi:hypothetical protein
LDVVVISQNNPLMANMGYDDQHPPAQTPGAISERGVATPWNEDYEFPASVGLVSAVYIISVISLGQCIKITFTFMVLCIINDNIG